MTIIYAVIPPLMALFPPKAIKTCNLKPIPCSSHFNSSHHTQESLRTSVIGDRPTQTHSLSFPKEANMIWIFNCVNFIMLKAVYLHLQHLKLSSELVSFKLLLFMYTTIQKVRVSKIFVFQRSVRFLFFKENNDYSERMH